jgi:hypothetical protein
MDILIAALLGLIQTVFGFAGNAVALKQGWSYRARIRFAILFAVLSSAGLALVIWQAIRASQSNEENRKTLLGDPERPPFVSIFSLPGDTRFITVNPSDYPAYGAHIQLHDEMHRTTSLYAYGPSDLAAHLASKDEKQWKPEDDASEHRFTAEITTRTGLVFEELILRKAGNDQWMRALRVRQGMRTLEQDVDSSWPRDKYGQPDWN